MGRIGITLVEVKAAIAELQGKQKNPTVDGIREILGTGSKSTIARFLREWKLQHGLHSSDDSRLPSELLEIVNSLWDALCNKAGAQVDEYCQESDAKMAQAQQQLSQAKQLEASLRLNVHALEEQAHQQTEGTRQLKAKLITEGQEKIRMTERVAALESRSHENHAENQRLHQLLQHVQENLEHYQAATQRLREEQSLLMEKHQNEYEQRLSQLLAQVNTATSEKSTCLAQYNQLTITHELLVTEHKTLITKYVEVQAKHESMKTVYDKTQHDYDMLKKQNQAQATELKTLQRAVTELQLNTKLREEKIILLAKATAKDHDKIEALRSENQFALQEKAGLEGQLKQVQAMLSSGKMRPVG